MTATEFESDTTVEPLHCSSEDELAAQVCRDSFRAFLEEFWESVPGAGHLTDNWHIDFYCAEAQKVVAMLESGAPRDYDLVINVPPGTSKSTTWSILLPAWVWVRVPWCRILSSSHTDALVTDLAAKSRQVIKSEKYRKYFPEITLREDQDTKGYFANTAGGDRFTCTVAGKTPMGFHAHLILCLPWESRIITDRGLLPIGEVVDGRIDARVLAYNHETGSPAWRRIEAYEENPGSPLSRLSFSTGEVLELTSNHPVYVEGRGYVEASEVIPGDEVYRAAQELQDLWCEGDLQERQDLLLQGVQESGDERNEPPKVQLRGRELHRVRETSEEVQKKGSGREEALLQLRVSGRVSEEDGRPPAGGEAHRGEVFPGRVREYQERHQLPHEDALVPLLLAGVRQSRPFRQDEGRGQLQLRSRSGVLGTDLQGGEEDQGGDVAGRAPMFLVRRATVYEGEVAHRPSHRLGSKEQSPVESRDPVLEVSREASQRPQVRSGSIGRAFVVSVEHGVRVPDKVYNVRVERDHNYFAEGVLVHNCDDPLDPKKALSEAEVTVARDFVDNILPTRKADRLRTITVLIMQRLGMGDPSEVMLEGAKRGGSCPVRHLCLPAELSKGDDGAWLEGNVSPPELAAMYVDGLLDTKRLDRRVLAEFKAKGDLFYSTQFLQKPYSKDGGMFPDRCFSLRCTAAPYTARRVRFWDMAASEGSGCHTAGVLVAEATHEAGIRKWYLEDVVVGQWDPFTRNQRILEIAHRDRVKYGPNNEPTIYVEREGGASGPETIQIITQVLAGFPCFGYNVSSAGSKERRAENWSAEMVAGNVFIVVGPTGKPDWDLEGYIKEHKAFPLAPRKDRVDASSGAFLALANSKRPAGQMRVFTFGDRPGTTQRRVRVVVCGMGDMDQLRFEEDWLLVQITNPEPNRAVLPPGPDPRMKGSLLLEFCDLDPAKLQEQWTTPVEPYNKPPAELVFGHPHGKRLWAFLSKKRDVTPWVYVVQDSGGGDTRAMSLAHGICDTLRLNKSETIWQMGQSDWTAGGDPPNPHLRDMVRATRHLVL